MAAFASHLPSLWNGFTWLDHGDLESRAAIAPPSGWLSLFTHGYARTGFYRPLTSLSLSLDALWGSPAMFHLDSLLLHALASALCALAALSLGLSRRAALIAGVLFAVNPVTTGLVADQIVYRNDSLAAAALFTLLFAASERRAWLCAIAMLAGALSKETALVLGPLFCVLVEATRARHPRELVRPERWKLAAAGAFVVALTLRLVFAPTWHATQPALTASEAVATRAGLVAAYLLKLTLADASICDAFPVLSFSNALAWAGVLAVVAFALVTWRRRGPLLFAALALLPALALVPVPRFFSPHYLYLPFAFIAMALAAELDRLRRAAWVIPGALSLFWAFVAFADARRYHDDESLFAAEMNARRECREGALYVGDARRARGELDGASAAYLQAAEPAPGFISYSDEAAAFQNLGLVRLSQQRFADAEAAFREAMARQKDERARRELRHDLAVAALGKGDAKTAVTLLRQEAARPDAMPESVELLARVLFSLHQDDEAKAVLANAQAKGILPR